MYSAEEIAKKINLILKDKGLSQKEMLEACELNKNTVSSMLYRIQSLEQITLQKSQTISDALLITYWVEKILHLLDIQILLLPLSLQNFYS